MDPVGGAFAIESLTDELERATFEYLDRIDSMGGMLAAIERGWVQSEIQNSAYRYQREIEKDERIVVGINEFQDDEDSPIPIHVIDPELERAQIENLNAARSNRDASAVSRALEQLEAAAQTDENLMPHILAAVESYATVGEIADAFRKVHGEYQEALTF